MKQAHCKYSNEIDRYIEKFPQEIQEIMNEIRRIIHESAPEVTEKISYQMPTFYYKENIVHFAGYKNHIGFYPTPSAIEAFKDKIKEYKWAKGSVQFPFSKPIPYDLVAEMTIFRYTEVFNKSKDL